MEKSLTDPDIDIKIAEREVRSAKARLGAEIEAATKTSRRMLRSMAQRVRPFVIGAAAIAGVVVLASIIRLIRGAVTRPPRLRFALPPPRPSLPRQLFHAAVTSAASAVASAAARKGVEKLGEVDRDVDRSSTANYS